MVLYGTMICLDPGLTDQPDGLESHSTIRFLSSLPVFLTVTVTVLALPVNVSGSAEMISPDLGLSIVTDLELDQDDQTEVCVLQRACALML